MINKDKTPRHKTKTATKTRTVSLDSFGNAIPEVTLARVEGTGKAIKVAETREIVVSAPKRYRKAKKARIIEPEKTGWFSRLRRSFRRSDAPESQQAAHDELVEDLSHRLEAAFSELKREFTEREQQLEQKLREVKLQHVAAIAQEKKQKTALKVALGVGGFSVVAYLLVVMTQMGGSMNNMTTSMSSMTGHIETMSGDTQVITQNLQQMNDSMSYMNYNVGQLNGSVGNMNYNVAQMNQNVGTMSQSVQPIGEAAQTATPVMKFFKSFMPF